MTQEDVQTRRDQLVKELEIHKANYQAVTGAIQDCDYWLEQLAKEGTDGKQQE